MCIDSYFVDGAVEVGRVQLGTENRNLYILKVYDYQLMVYSMLTANEKKVLRLLATGLAGEYSINGIARLCGMAPNGAFKLLNKMETLGILKVKRLANIKAYALNFESSQTEPVLQLALMPDRLIGRVASRADDLVLLKQVARICILFGSYIAAKNSPNDLDVLFVLERTDFESYKKALVAVQEIVPVKIHDVVQTVEDLKQNLLKKDPIVIKAVRNGVVLWGFDVLAEVVKNVWQ